MTCRNCNKTISGQGGLCLTCLLTTFGTPYDADYKLNEAFQARRDAERGRA